MTRVTWFTIAAVVLGALGILTLGRVYDVAIAAVPFLDMDAAPAAPEPLPPPTPYVTILSRFATKKGKQAAGVSVCQFFIATERHIVRHFGDNVSIIHGVGGEMFPGDVVDHKCLKGDIAFCVYKMGLPQPHYTSVASAPVGYSAMAVKACDWQSCIMPDITQGYRWENWIALRVRPLQRGKSGSGIFAADGALYGILAGQYSGYPKAVAIYAASPFRNCADLRQWYYGH